MTQTAPARGPAVSDRASRRATWIDNLWVAIIVGVIGSHVSVIYALDVGWWYEERTASEIAKAVLAGVFAPGLLFGMGLMFFVAGWFTPPAFERKVVEDVLVSRRHAKDSGAAPLRARHPAATSTPALGWPQAPYAGAPSIVSAAARNLASIRRTTRTAQRREKADRMADPSRPTFEFDPLHGSRPTLTAHAR